MRGDYWIPEQESLITNFEDQCLKTALDLEYNIILDSTNLNFNTLKHFKEIIQKYPKYEIEYKLFNTDLSVCINRDSKRISPVGETIITKFYNKYFKNEFTNFT